MLFPFLGLKFDKCVQWCGWWPPESTLTSAATGKAVCFRRRRLALFVHRARTHVSYAVAAATTYLQTPAMAPAYLMWVKGVVRLGVAAWACRSGRLWGVPRQLVVVRRFGGGRGCGAVPRPTSNPWVEHVTSSLARLPAQLAPVVLLGAADS